MSSSNCGYGCSNVFSPQTCYICRRDWCFECLILWRIYSRNYDTYNEQENQEFQDKFTCVFCFIDKFF